MTISLKHAFTSGKADGTDSTLVQPSNWNAEHTLQLATSKLVGRTTAGTGSAEEISVGSGLTFSSGSLSANVTSVAGRTGAVTLAVADVSGAAPLASPTFTGTINGAAAALTGNATVGGTLGVTGAFSSATVADAVAIIRPLVSDTAKAATSGTNLDFNTIPSWVKRITLMFNAVSTNGTSPPLVQIGAGSIQNTSYVSYSSTIAAASSTLGSSTAGFIMQYASASATLVGHMVITNVSGNIWVASHQGAVLSTNTLVGGGTVTLSGTLDRVRLTTVNGSDTFDAGSVNILYE